MERKLGEDFRERERGVTLVTRTEAPNSRFNGHVSSRDLIFVYQLSSIHSCVSVSQYRRLFVSFPCLSADVVSQREFSLLL